MQKNKRQKPKAKFCQGSGKIKAQNRTHHRERGARPNATTGETAEEAGEHMDLNTERKEPQVKHMRAITTGGKRTKGGRTK